MRLVFYLGWTEGTSVISGVDREDVYLRWRGCWMEDGEDFGFGYRRKTCCG